MASPRPWEVGDGTVKAFVPDRKFLQDYKQGTLTLAQYRARWESDQRLGGFDIRPGYLMATLADGSTVPVTDQDTLCCSCSVDTARAHACHRVWTALELQRAGWDVLGDWEDRNPFFEL